MRSYLETEEMPKEILNLVSFGLNDKNFVNPLKLYTVWNIIKPTSHNIDKLSSIIGINSAKNEFEKIVFKRTYLIKRRNNLNWWSTTQRYWQSMTKIRQNILTLLLYGKIC